MDTNIINTAVKLYESGKSLSNIGALYGIKPQTLHYHLKKQIKLRNYIDSAVSKKCKNDFYFDVIDTHEKAYWLGMLMADGNVNLQNRIALYQHINDSYILKNFITALDVDTEIKYDGNCAYVAFKSTHMTEVLRTYGLFHNKSYTAFFPSINVEFRGALIRGIFDGDGYIGVIDKKKPPYQYCIHIVGTKSVMVGIAETIYTECNLPIPKFRDTMSSHKGIYKISYGGNNKVKLFGDYMYNNSHITNRLRRKYEIYKIV